MTDCKYSEFEKAAGEVLCGHPRNVVGLCRLYCCPFILKLQKEAEREND
ncbi:MAG: hypothetical protein R6U96_04675 [Promethearchaeia archaeon]